MTIMYEPNELYKPTLRLSIIERCYGRCSFCHNEGQNECCTDNRITLKSFESQIIPAIKKIGIRKTVLTGGEPTLHPDLLEISRMLKEACPNLLIAITTNGYNIPELSRASAYLDKITISLSSYKSSVYMRYTAINPKELTTAVNHLKIKEKSASIVITEDNINEIIDLVLDLINQEYEVKLQYAIGKETVESNQKSELYDKLCEHLGECRIMLAATPTVYWTCENGKEVRLKLTALNGFIYNNLIFRKKCLYCKNKTNCAERGCSVRVHSDGKVTPCLDNYIVYEGEPLQKCIEKAYEDMSIAR